MRECQPNPFHGRLHLRRAGIGDAVAQKYAPCWPNDARIGRKAQDLTSSPSTSFTQRRCSIARSFFAFSMRSSAARASDSEST